MDSYEAWKSHNSKYSVAYEARKRYNTYRDWIFGEPHLRRKFNEDTVLYTEINFGKYKGDTFYGVRDYDGRYFHWLEDTLLDTKIHENSKWRDVRLNTLLLMISVDEYYENEAKQWE